MLSLLIGESEYLFKFSIQYLNLFKALSVYESPRAADGYLMNS